MYELRAILLPEDVIFDARNQLNELPTYKQMNHFPVTNSNLSATHLVVYLRTYYAFSANANCTLIKAGINDTYLITDEDTKFVLRVYSYNWRTRTEIEEELELLNLLKGQGISVSYPVADKHKNYIHTLNAPEGDRFAVLFSYAPGEKVQVVSKEAHFQVGQLMAKLHQVTLNKQLERVSYSAEVLLVDSLKEIAAFLGKETEEMQFMKSAQAYLKHFLQMPTQLKFDKGLFIWISGSII